MCARIDISSAECVVKTTAVSLFNILSTNDVVSLARGMTMTDVT